MSAKRIIRRNWYRAEKRPGELFREFLRRMGCRTYRRTFKQRMR